MTPQDDTHTFDARPPDALAHAMDGVSELEQIKAELAEATTIETLVLPVPGRPGWEVEYSTGIVHDQLRAWQRKVRGRGRSTTDVDELLFAAIICANQCQRLLRRGEPLELDGVEQTFATPEFLELIDVARATDAVKRLYGADAHVISAGEEILVKAGYGQSLEDMAAGDDATVDPSKP